MTTLAKDTETNAAAGVNAIFAGEGFPLPVCRAFQAAANKTKMAILSRVPGGSCGRLIDERYDLKGYFIKAKSCNWGPMAGFLCQLPPFNKAGAAKMAENAKANDKTYELINKVVQFAAEKGRPPNDKEEVDLVQDHSKTFVFEKASTPFVHLKISDARKREIEAEKARFRIELWPTKAPEVLYAIAWDREATVCAEFLLVKEGDLWGLYHGDVFVWRDKAWQSFLDLTSSSEFFPYYNKYSQAQLTDNRKTLCKILERIKTESNNAAYAVRSELVPGNDRAITDKLPIAPRLRDALKSFTGQARPFYPVLGIKNPFPAYQSDGSPHVLGKAGGTDHHKNAVTGDFDLFAVWDLRNGLDEAEGKEIRRASERGARFSVLANGIRVEVVPSFAALEAPETKEDPRWGNASDNVLLAVGSLNSNMATVHAAQDAAAAKPGGQLPQLVSPNAAFHSDEGGRPGIDAIEFPVAVFVTVAREAKSTPGEITEFYRAMINTKEEFLELLEFLRPTYRLGLHVGWVYDLLNSPPPIAARAARLLGVDPGRVQLAALRAVLDGKRATKPADDVAAVKAALGL